MIWPASRPSYHSSRDSASSAHAAMSTASSHAPKKSASSAQWARSRRGSSPNTYRSSQSRPAALSPTAPVGAGPIIRVGDRARVYTPELIDFCVRVAQALALRKRKFQFQRKLMDGRNVRSRTLRPRWIRSVRNLPRAGQLPQHGHQAEEDRRRIRQPRGLARNARSLRGSRVGYRRAPASQTTPWQRDSTACSRVAKTDYCDMTPIAPPSLVNGLNPPAWEQVTTPEAAYERPGSRSP